jgi:NAD(P)-dependent dehydrogenase (short-subunit alcohol dehydrogenase family)
MTSYVITGGASGIGAETVRLLIEQDPQARVGALDRSATEHPDPRVLPLSVDVTDRSAVFTAFQEIREWAGEPITGLVCCAGIQRRIPSAELDEGTWSTVLGVHLQGTLWAAQAALPYMETAGGGSIVTFSSIAEKFAWPRRLPYAVAKAGVGAMTRTLAVEWAPLGVRVNAIAPGYVNTPMVREAIDAGALDEESLVEAHALPRLADPSEIARAALFLLSDASSFVTGETLYVDGGWSIRKGS